MKVLVKDASGSQARPVAVHYSRVESNAAMLQRLLSNNGLYLVTVHNGVLVKVAPIPRDLELRVEDVCQPPVADQD